MSSKLKYGGTETLGLEGVQCHDMISATGSGKYGSKTIYYDTDSVCVVYTTKGFKPTVSSYFL